MPPEPKREIANAIRSEYDRLHNAFETRMSINPHDTGYMHSDHPTLVAHDIRLNVGTVGVVVEIPRALVKWSKTTEELAPEAKITGTGGLLGAWEHFRQENPHAQDTPLERHRVFRDEPDPHLPRADDEETQPDEAEHGQPGGAKDGHYASVTLPGHPKGEGALLRFFHRTQKGEGRTVAIFHVRKRAPKGKPPQEVVRYWFDNEYASPLIDRVLNHRFFFTPDGPSQ